MDPTHDADCDDDLDERLARVFEERGIPKPPPRAAARPLPAPPQGASAQAPLPRPQATPQACPRPAPAAGRSAAAAAPPRRSGRREKTILLAMLGTLAGAFVGVLSMKLLVPRPPHGAGPDIHLESAGSGGLDLVDPPALTALPPAAAIPPDPFRSLGLPPAAPDDEQTSFRETGTHASDAAIVPERDDAAPAPRRFSRTPPADRLAPTAPPDLAPVPPDAAPPASRFGATPLGAPDDESLPERPEAFVSPPDRFDPRAAGVIATAGTRPFAAESAPDNALAPVAGGGYVVREGDTWWSVAESSYGDGRLYKALFAWNRTLDPRVSLSPGTRLELPREEQLRAAWGRLVPTGAP